MKNEIENFAKSVSKISDFIQKIPKDIIKNKEDLLEIGNLGNELLKTFNEGKKLDIIDKTIQFKLQKIAYDFHKHQSIIENVFQERRTGLEMHFKALDHAIATNNNEGILNALKGATHIISNSPFEDIEKIRAALSNKDETLYLDF